MHMHHATVDYLGLSLRQVFQIWSATNENLCCRLIRCRQEWSHIWWRHHMETFSASLAFCAGNSPVTGEFPAQRPVTGSFDVFLMFLVASLMSLMASLVTTSRMQQCFNVPIDSYHEFPLLFYCCVLLEIKLTTTTTLIWAWINGWVNNDEVGDLRRHRAHYDVNVMT